MNSNKDFKDLQYGIFVVLALVGCSLSSKISHNMGNMNQNQDYNINSTLINDKEQKKLISTNSNLNLEDKIYHNYYYKTEKNDLNDLNDQNDQKSLNQDKQNTNSHFKPGHQYSEKSFYKKYTQTVCKCSCGEALKSRKISDVLPIFEEDIVKCFSKKVFKSNSKEAKIIYCNLCNAIMINGKNNALPIWSCKSKNHNRQTYNVCVYCANGIKLPEKQKCSSCHGMNVFPLIKGTCSLCIPYIKSIALGEKINDQLLCRTIKYKSYDTTKLKELYEKLDSSKIKGRMELLFAILSEQRSGSLFPLKKEAYSDIDHKQKIISLVKVKKNNSLLKDIANKNLITEDFKKISLNTLRKRVYLNFKLDKKHKQYLHDLIDYIKESQKTYSCNLTDYYYTTHEFYPGQKPPQTGSKFSYLFFVFDKNTIYGIKETSLFESCL